MTYQLPKQKLNVFLVCLICSFMAWSVSKLSENRTDVITFNLDFTNVPDSLILDKASPADINLRVNASGFRFLLVQFSSRKLGISLDQVKKSPSGYYLPRPVLLAQIERQLPGTMNLLEAESDTLYIGFMDVESKKVPVVGNVVADLGQNYLLEGEIEISPDSIQLHGPHEEIDSISRILTQRLYLRDITADFSRTIGLLKPAALRHTTFSDSIIQVRGKVFRFSEKIIDVPVTVIHLPEGTEIKTFPPTIPVLCKADIEKLRELEANDFRIVADYATLKEGESFLRVSLTEKPGVVHSVQLLEERIEFILKRE